MPCQLQHLREQACIHLHSRVELALVVGEGEVRRVGLRAGEQESQWGDKFRFL